jgi:glycosyltransferase involved in cell wall biosynthesis
MHVGFLTHCLPVPDANGGASTCWALLHALRDAGHETALYYLREPYDQSDTPERLTLLEPLIEALVTLPVPPPPAGPGWDQASWGAKLVRVLRDECWQPPMALLFPSALLRAPLEEALGRVKPDVLFIYHWAAAAVAYGWHHAPKLIITGDLSHRPTFCRWRQLPIRPSAAYAKRTLFALRDRLHHPRVMTALLNEADAGGSFGAYDAAWLRRHGATQSRYFRTPLVDTAGPDWQARRAAVTNARPKILIGISALSSTSTAASLRFFATAIFPILERELGREGFEVHVIGRGEPPAEVARLSGHPAIKIRGYVDDLEPEWYSADVVLVPTPIFLGFRVRILTAFAYGCCVVAHTNERINVPEIVHGENALLAGDGAGLAREVIRALRDAALRRRLGEAARRTYEERFSVRSAGEPIVAELERLAALQAPAVPVGGGVV